MKKKIFEDEEEEEEGAEPGEEKIDSELEEKMIMHLKVGDNEAENEAEV